MKLFFQYRISLLVLLFFAFYHFDVNAQNKIFDNYLDTVGDYATIYRGRVEAIYNLNLYENLPYYKNESSIFESMPNTRLSIKKQQALDLYKEQSQKNSDFTSGEIVYKDRFYPNQQLRLDLYKEQLITLSPEKHYGIVLESKDIQKVILYGKTFVWYAPIMEKDLKPGFYMQLHEGSSMTLLCKIFMSLDKGLTSSSFTSKTRFYLLFNGDYYTVKNKKSFTKIFPQYKNQINQFVKERKLNFGSELEKSLTLLAEYCESLF